MRIVQQRSVCKSVQKEKRKIIEKQEYSAPTLSKKSKYVNRNIDKVMRMCE